MDNHDAELQCKMLTIFELFKSAEDFMPDDPMVINAYANIMKAIADFSMAMVKFRIKEAIKKESEND